MESSSLCTFQAMVTAAASSSSAVAPLALRRRGACLVQPPQRWRARGTDPRAFPSPEKGRWRLKLPGTNALRVGAGVAMALVLGGVSWTARGRRNNACPILQPALVCVLNNSTGGGSSMKKRFDLDAFMDELSPLLSRLMDKEKLGDDEEINDRRKLANRLENQFKKRRDADDGLKLAEAWMELRDWVKAKDTCQKLTRLDPTDPRPRLLLVVINMTQSMETMLSRDPTTTDDIENKAEKLKEMTTIAIDEWKEYIKKRNAL